MRQNVYTVDEWTGEKKLEGWYDDATTTWYEENRFWDGQNMASATVGANASEVLGQTRSGRFVIHKTSRWQGEQPASRFVTREQARDWLLTNEYSADEVGEIVGEEVPEESGPVGRPPVGDRSIKILMDDELADRIASAAAAEGISQAAWIRRACGAALDA